MLNISKNRSLLNKDLSINFLGSIYIETKDLGSIEISQKSVLELLDCQNEKDENVLNEWIKLTNLAIEYANIIKFVSIINNFFSQSGSWLTLHSKVHCFTKGNFDFLDLKNCLNKNEVKKQLEDKKNKILDQFKSIINENVKLNRTLNVDQKGNVVVCCENIDISLRLNEKDFSNMILEYLKNEFSEKSNTNIERLLNQEMNYLNIKKSRDFIVKIEKVFDKTIEEIGVSKDSQEMSEIFINHFISQLLNTKVLKIEDYDDIEDE